MEQFQCINKVWISEKERILDKVLWVCGWICVALNLIMISMEGIEAISIPSVIFAGVMLLWAGANKKRSGRYVNSSCVLSFTDQILVWEYPSLDTGNGIFHMKYTITPPVIVDVVLSTEIHSIRLACKPLIESVDEKEKRSVTDCMEKNRQCVLILYNENIEYIRQCIEKYLYTEIDIVD